MSRRTIAIAAALSVLALGSPLIAARAKPPFEQYVDQGVERYNSGNYRGALAAYTKAIEIEPQIAELYNYRGDAKRNLQDFQGAIADYTKTIEIKPQYANAYLNRGIDREIVNDLKGACLDWRKAAGLGKENAAEWVKNQCS